MNSSDVSNGTPVSCTDVDYLHTEALFKSGETANHHSPKVGDGRAAATKTSFNDIPTEALAKFGVTADHHSSDVGDWRAAETES